MIEAQHIKSNLDLEPLKLQKSLLMLETVAVVHCLAVS